jgi:hypothetical protein
MNMHIAQDDPSAWVARFAGLIPAGRVLDLACGGGRHARLMAALGHALEVVPKRLQRGEGMGLSLRPAPLQRREMAGFVEDGAIGLDAHRPLDGLLHVHHEMARQIHHGQAVGGPDARLGLHFDGHLRLGHESLLRMRPACWAGACQGASGPAAERHKQRAADAA